MNQPTRTIFLHISPVGQAVFYGLALLALIVCIHGFRRRWVLWRQGRPISPVPDWPKRMKAVFDQAVMHRRTRRRKYAGGMHALIFFGIVVLFLGTCVVAIEH